eukprot:scaffold60_cov137-Skeletonema_marinoi.AAC.16
MPVLRITHNPNFRHNDCGYTYSERDGKQTLLSLKIAPCAVSTYIPVLYGGRHGQYAFLAYLAHHIAVPSAYSKGTVDWFQRFYEKCPLIFRQDPSAISCTDPASKRFYCGIHTFTNTKYGRHPICEDNEENHGFINHLLNAILKYGHQTLGVPKDNLALTRADIRGYDLLAFIGGHNDTPNVTHTKKCGLRAFVKVGGETKVVYTLKDYNPDTDNQPNVFQDEFYCRQVTPQLELVCENGFSVYASSAFASGHLPLGINGDKNDGSFIIAYHRVDEVIHSKSTSMVIDFFFDSVKDTMAALEKIRQDPFHLDFSASRVRLSLSFSATTIEKEVATTTSTAAATVAAGIGVTSVDRKRKATGTESNQGKLTDYWNEKKKK